MRTAARLFVLPWYLVGWILHLYLGLNAPEVYLPFGSTAILPGFSALWCAVVMPHISSFALLLAGFELAVASLLLSGGASFRVGVALSIAFNAFLVQMGLGYHVVRPVESFMVNRVPNLVFMAIQAPLLLGPEAQPMSDVARGWLRRIQRPRRPA
jgi:hypothetical protein